MTIASFSDEGMQPLVIDIIIMGRVNMGEIGLVCCL